MGRYYSGLIVWAWVADGHGNTKRRPVVVIDPGDPRNADDDLLVVPITKSPDEPCPSYHVQVHSSNVKDPDTGLYYPCWAKCNWARDLHPSKIAEKLGDMPDDILILIADAYDVIFDDENFTDWH